MIGLISGTVTAAARSLGHYISLGVTSLLMLFVGGTLLRSAFIGQRSWMYGPDSPNPSWCKRFGPLLIQQLAACLIVADPLRHCLFDIGLWAGCSNNPTYQRINTTNAFPPLCYDSSYQYLCSVPCCVPVWQPGNDSSTKAEFSWFPPQSQFPELATLRANDTVYLPPGFDAAQQPWDVFKPSTFLWETGAAHTTRGTFTDKDCKFGVNSETGYCFLIDETSPMPYEERVKQLPLKDVSKPFDAVTNPHECNCNQCTIDETITHLQPLGIVFTIVFTYSGFALLAVAVGWNANIVQKLKGIKAKWRALRGA